MSDMIEGIVIAWYALLGLIIGSFLNVVIYRFNTGKSLQGRSRCLSCGETLSWWHLVPVFSFMCLRARCSFCSARISFRYVAVELLTAFSFGLVAYLVHDFWLQPLYAVLMSVLVVILVYDILHMIIPDSLVLALGGIALVLAGYDAWLLFSFFDFALQPVVSMVGSRILAAAVGFLFFASLWRVSNGRWIGFGDAKLAIPLGFIVGWPGIISTIILSFWVGAAVSVFLLALQTLFARLKRGQHRLRFIPHSLTIKSEIPFAPFLIIGFLLVHFFAIDVFILIGNGIEKLGFFGY